MVPELQIPMPRTCTLCKHPQRDSIDRALLAGDSYRHIAARFDTSTGALQRHKADHLPKTLVKAHEARVVARADSLLDQVFRQEALFDELDQTAKVIQESAIGEKDRRGALEAISVRGTSPTNAAGIWNSSDG
jgi:hypothetical protein